MKIKYRIDGLSYFTCDKCSKELIEKLSMVDEIFNVSINYNDETIEVESYDGASKDKIDEIVQILEDESYCWKHKKNHHSKTTIKYEDECGEFNPLELKKRINTDERIDNIEINEIEKTITIKHKSNIDSYLIIEKVVKDIDNDVVLERVVGSIQKKINYSLVYKIISYSLGLLLFGLGIIFKYVEENTLFRITSFVMSYIFIGHEVLLSCFNEFNEKNIFNEELLMIIASIGALAIGEEIEAIALVILYTIGEFVEDKVTDKALDSIKEMMHMTVDEVTLEDGRVLNIDDVSLGDVIVVKPFEVIPLDGEVVDGESSIDTKKMTGEALLQYVAKGSPVISGTLNQNGLLKIKVLKENHDSEANKLEQLINEASEKKSKAESFVEKFSKIYTPIVLSVALLIFIVQFFIMKLDIKTSFNNMFVALVISCPCAIVISVPLAYSAAVGKASRISVIVRSTAYIEEMSKLKAIVLDKTGTLTEGNFTVSKFELFGDKYKEEDVLPVIASLEAYSTHPIGKLLSLHYSSHINKDLVISFEETPGMGITAKYGDLLCILGSRSYISNYVEISIGESGYTEVYLLINNELVSRIILNDKTKHSAYNALNVFKNNNIKTYLLTGDNYNNTLQLSNELGINHFETGLLPSGKLGFVEDYLKDKTNRSLAYVGDGMNDAACLKIADIGIAMGYDSSDAAKEAADVVVLSSDISKVSDLYKISVRTHRIALFNLIFSILIKLLAVVIALAGLLSSLNGLLMLIGIFADVGVALICVFNSSRILRFKE